MSKPIPSFGTVLINLILLRPELYNLLPMRKLIKSYNTHINYQLFEAVFYCYAFVLLTLQRYK